MPAKRSGYNKPRHELERLSFGESVFTSGASTSKEKLTLIPTPSVPGAAVSLSKPKRKKTSNAFILFRSHVIANNLLPAGIKHQNEVSRLAGALWREQGKETSDYFYRKAEEEKQRSLMDEGGFEIVKKKRTRKVRLTKKKPVAQTPSLSSSPYSGIPARSDASTSNYSPASSGGDISPASYPVTPTDPIPLTMLKNSLREVSHPSDTPVPSLAPFRPGVESTISGLELSSYPSVYSDSEEPFARSRGGALDLLISPAANETEPSEKHQSCADIFDSHRNFPALALAPMEGFPSSSSSFVDDTFMDEILDLRDWGSNGALPASEINYSGGGDRFF